MAGGRRPGAGRPGGKLNALGMAAKEIMEAKNYNPFEALIDIATDDNTPLDLRVASHKELCKYHSPQLKALDINMAVKGGLAVKLISFADEQKILDQQKEIYEAHQKTLIAQNDNVIDVQAEEVVNEQQQ